MTIAEIETVLFVGAGTMGCANSLVAALAGYSVVVHDEQVASLEAVPARHDEIAAVLVASGFCSEAGVADARSRVSVVDDLAEAAQEADLISESVFEDLAVKRAVHRELDRVAPPDAILTTNTSSLLVSEIEDVVARGDRFAALHSHLGSLLFDIVGGPRTRPETVDVLERYVRSLGGEPLTLRKEHHGYVFNAMNGPLLATALRLVVDGRATPESVDRAWMRSRGAPLGPFAMIDLFGVDLVSGAWHTPDADPDREALRQRVRPLLDGLVEDGRLGQKAGRGFYAYPDPGYQAADFVAAEPVDPDVVDALTVTVIAAAVALVDHDVASATDVDRAWTAATGLEPGPLALLAATDPGDWGLKTDRQVATDVITAEAAALTAEYRRNGVSG